jgi:adenylate cyclase
LSTNNRRTAFRLAGVAVVAALITHAVALTGTLDRANRWTFDRLLQLRNRAGALRPAPVSAVVHVDIDDASMRALGGRQPGRDEIAAVMTTMGSAGAAAQAYDFVFAAEEEPSSLAVAAKTTGSVYAGAAVQEAHHAADAFAKPGAGWPAWPIRVEGNTDAIPQAIAVTLPFHELQTSLRGIGFLNVSPDADGVFRRLPLLARGEHGFYPSLALAVACGYLGVTPDRVLLRPGRELVLHDARVPGDAPHDLVIPIDASAAMILNFAGDWTYGAHYRFAEIWRDGMDPTAGPRWADALRGRIAIVGDVSTGQADIGAVPGDAEYPLPGLHATALRTILGGAFLADAPAWLTWLAKVAALALIVICGAFRPRWMWPAAALVTGAVIALGGGLFLRGGLILNLVQPMLAIALMTAATGAWQYFDESRERELTRRAFESYFPPAVVTRILADPRRVAGSRRKDVTVLFSDISGFTARSSQMAPEAVQAFLDAYFSRMVDVVFRHGGTVDKFIGDGLMVFFNDPEDQPDHAERAVRCAMEMQKAVQAFSAELTRQGHGAVLVRIGINTGSAIVGDLGPSTRLSYTAVGATVNLAQRLESAATPGGILVSAATAASLPRDLVMPAGEVSVKGFAAPVRVFEVAGMLEGVRS